MSEERGGWMNGDWGDWQRTPWWAFWRPRWYRWYQYWDGGGEFEFATDGQLARLTLEERFAPR